MQPTKQENYLVAMEFLIGKLLIRSRYGSLQFSSVQFSRSVVSNSLQPHGLQHASPPCPSPIPGAYSNSSPLSQWRHPTISSSVIPFSSHLQSFSASGSFPMSQLFALGSQSIVASASASVLPKSIEFWSPEISQIHPLLPPPLFMWLS